MIACTNVDRVVFPGDGIKKGDLIAYYHAVAEVMVPELRRRPLSVVRFTKGIAQGGFFQKHRQKHYPAWIESVVLGTKTRVDYPLCDSPAALVYFANQGAIEFHIWTSRAEAPGHPDLLVFDLDPPEGKFDLARRTALALREIFEELELPAFVKTTGGKGLHVVAPLDGAATFEEVAALSVRISQRLCAARPDELTMEFYKKDRGERLFLDTMRNGLGATIVAPYSVRGRPGAPVSMPVEWREVEDRRSRRTASRCARCRAGSIAPEIRGRSCARSRARSSRWRGGSTSGDPSPQRIALPSSTGQIHEGSSISVSGTRSMSRSTRWRFAMYFGRSTSRASPRNASTADRKRSISVAWRIRPRLIIASMSLWSLTLKRFSLLTTTSTMSRSLSSKWTSAPLISVATCQ